MDENLLTNEIRDRLKEVMSKKNVNQTELCKRTGINKGTLSNFLKGRYGLKYPAFYRIAKALNISVIWLMFGELSNEPELTDREAEIIRIYRSLTPELKGIADAYFNLWKAENKALSNNKGSDYYEDRKD